MTEFERLTELKAAFDKANRLRAELGDEDPLTMAAIIHAVDLADPTYCGRMMAECGITLPEATHCDQDGAALYSVGQLAAAVGQPVAAVQAKVEELADLGVMSAAPGPVLERH